eukprot:6260596-Alexandrium_andersonii.AAC.1
MQHATSLYVSVNVPCCHTSKESLSTSIDGCSRCHRSISQPELARAVVGSGPDGGTEAPSRAKRKPYGPGIIINA